jgi:hypothetical protein
MGDHVEDEEELLIEVVWDQSSRLVAQLSVSPDTRLLKIHEHLLKIQGDLGDFHYTFNSKPIFPEFYSVFKARHLAPVLVIRHGGYELRHEDSNN